MGCQLPLDKDPTTLRECKGAKDFENYLKVVFQQASQDTNKLIQLVDCELPCQRDEYSLGEISRSEEPCPAENFPQGCKGLMKIYIFIRDGDVEHIEEKWLYDLSNFIADVGGYMGLLLGASVLTVYNMALKALARVRGVCCGTGTGQLGQNA